jgi:eukaryotic-like serine/threonine-protein kinase
MIDSQLRSGVHSTKILHSDRPSGETEEPNLGSRVERSARIDLIPTRDGTEIDSARGQRKCAKVLLSYMSLACGTVIGPYRIDRLLGVGGMGEVYKATHLVLGRDVALKTLRPGKGEPESQSFRLIREARAVSTLQHPNIVAVYDVIDLDQSLYIAMEYVEGETLRQILSERVLRPTETIRYAVQIAKALAAAHAGGMLHRDVKPGNIMITARSVVKVVDFGLAKPFVPLENFHHAPTQTFTDDPVLTLEGLAVGTPGYMSPEQIQGLHVDARSDVFSFGIVLYEMLTRVHPFAAQSMAGMAAKILHSEPRPVREIVADVPGELDDVVRFCLRKEPEDRAQSMLDVAHMLESAQRAIERPGATVATAQGTKRRRLISVGVVALALIAGWTVHTLVTPRGERARPRPILRRMTWDAGLASSPALSNDGRLLAFASDRADGKSLDIFVRHTAEGEPIRLTSDPADDKDPSFSPDGGLIAFRSERRGGGIYTVPSLGGQERLIVPGGNNPRFSPDGNWIAYWVGEAANMMPSARMYIVPASGGAPRQLQPSFADARYPVWTPDGAHIIFEGVESDANPDRDWWVTPLDSGRAAKTGAWDSFHRAGFSFIYPPGGWHGNRVVFSAQDDMARSVFDVPVSNRTWQIESPPDPLTFGTGIEGWPCPTLRGAIAFTSFQYEINIWSRGLDASGRVTDKESQKITSGGAYHSSISTTAHGTRLVFLLGRSPSGKVWVRDLTTERQAAVDIDAVDKCSAIISADGSQVAWSVCGPPRQAIYTATINPDFSARLPEKVCEDCGRVMDWSRTGDSILFADHSTPVRLGILSLNSKSINMVSSSRSNLDNARLSADGAWIALTAAQTRGDRSQIFAVPLTDGKPAPESGWVTVTNGDSWDDSPVWTERGDALLFYSRRDGFGCIWRQAVNRVTKRPEGEPSEVLAFHTGRLSLLELPSHRKSMALADNHIFFNALESTGSIWMLDLPSR